MILILTGAEDKTFNLVEPKLRQRGQQVARFDTSRFPAHAALSVAWSPAGRTHAQIRDGDTVIYLDQVTAVWFRGAEPPVPHDTILDPQTREVVADESKAVLLDAWHATNCLWLPGRIPVVRDTQRKQLQLSLAGEIGFELPPTLVTTDPDELLAFYKENDGKIISKLADLGFHKLVGREFARYTEVVSPRDIANVEAARFCPMIYQAYVPKRVELRVTVVGQEVFAAEIRSQESNHTRHDWRRYDDKDTTYAAHELPDDIRRLCLQMTERLGLCYGAIDLVLTPDGRYVFLEINPAGQYMWIEQATGLPISDAICDVLVSGAASVPSHAHASHARFGGVL